MVHTGAARAGVENMTKTLAVEWAQHGIAVNAVAPGIIRSSGTDQYPPELLEMSRQQTPLKRLGTPEEVAELCAYLASDAAVVRHRRDVVHRRRRAPLGRHLDHPRPRGPAPARGHRETLRAEP